MEETKIIYHIDDEDTPYLIKLAIPSVKVTLADFKNALNRPNYKFFFKSMDDDFGVVKEEITDESKNLPVFNGRVVSWLVSAESSDAGSQCSGSQPGDLPNERGAGIGDSRPPSFHAHAPPRGDDDTETESAVGSRRDGRGGGGGPPRQNSANQPRNARHRNYYPSNAPGQLNGHPRPGPKPGYGSGRPGYDTASSMMSSDLETTSFFDSDEDSVLSTSTANTNQRMVGGRPKRKQRRKNRLPPMSRATSFSSITDSTMSLNIITVTLNLDVVNFLGISIVGQTNKGGDGGIYVGSIMKGGAVAQDGRIEPGDMILEVNGQSFENMSNDDAVQALRNAVTQPGLITLVVAKCWDPDPNPQFTIPRQEPVRPIDPSAWVLHTEAARAGAAGPQTGLQYGMMRPPVPAPGSVSTMSATSSSLTSSGADTEKGLPYKLTVNTDLSTIVHTMLKPDSGLQIRDRQWLKITIPNAFIGQIGYGNLSVNMDRALVVKAIAQPDSGLEVRDRMWLKITIPNAFIGSDLVEWLFTHVEGFADRRDARKYAANLLKAGFIRHTVNKITFSEQCYYVFGDLCSAQNLDYSSDMMSSASNLGPHVQNNMSSLTLEDIDSVSEVGAGGGGGSTGSGGGGGGGGAGAVMPRTMGGAPHYNSGAHGFVMPPPPAGAGASGPGATAPPHKQDPVMGRNMQANYWSRTYNTNPYGASYNPQPMVQNYARHAPYLNETASYVSMPGYGAESVHSGSAKRDQSCACIVGHLNKQIRKLWENPEKQNQLHNGVGDSGAGGAGGSGAARKQMPRFDADFHDSTDSDSGSSASGNIASRLQKQNGGGGGSNHSNSSDTEGGSLANARRAGFLPPTSQAAETGKTRPPVGVDLAPPPRDLSSANQYPDITASRQSFKMAMANRCDEELTIMGDL